MTPVYQIGGRAVIVGDGINQADVLFSVSKAQAEVAPEGQRMTDVSLFGNSYIAAVKALLQDVEVIRTLQDRAAQDTTLFAQFVALGIRNDLKADDFSNASSALTQILFTLDSGPPQKAFLYKLL